MGTNGLVKKTWNALFIVLIQGMGLLAGRGQRGIELRRKLPSGAKINALALSVFWE
jgi:hypothetical protein